MSSMDAQSGVVPAEGDSSGGARVSVTFSAPFYTGVFLSSRELRSEYRCHIEMIKQKMEDQLSWGWEESQRKFAWNCSLSSDYFLGCDVNDKEILRDFTVESGLNNFEIYQISVSKFSVRFFEFGFGSVSVTYSVSPNFPLTILKDYQSSFKLSLSRISAKVCNVYKKSVPCCVIDIDIQDIYNFQKVEQSKFINGNWNLQQVSAIVTVYEEKTFYKINHSLKSEFYKLDDNLSSDNLLCLYSFFAKHGNEGIVGICMSKNVEEINSFVLTVELLNVYLAVVVYFDSFFYFYFDFVASEYELYEGTGGSRSKWRNLLRLKSLGEKFSDVLLIYSQTVSLVQNHFPRIQDQRSNYSNQREEYQVQRYYLKNFPVRQTIDRVIKQTERKIKNLEQIHDQIDRAKNLYAIEGGEHASFFTALLQLLTLFVALATLVVTTQAFENTVNIEFLNIEFHFRCFAIIIMCLFFSFMLLFAWRLITHSAGEPKFFFRHRPRKLFHLKRKDKKQLKKMLKKRNETRKKSRYKQCAVSNCHRCSTKRWHGSISL